MEKAALTFIQKALDKATQKGVYNLAEVANIVAALEQLDKVINVPEQKTNSEK
jgi:hypothetical protein